MKRFDKMKLAAKLILLFIIAVTAVTIMASQLASMQSFAGLEKRHRAIASSVDANQKTSGFQTAANTGTNIYFENLVRTLANNGTRIRWTWLETDSLVVRIDPSIINNSSGQPVSTIDTASSGKRKYFTYVPVTLDGRQGAVEIATPLNDLDSQSRSNWFTAIFIIVATGFMCIGVVMIAGVRWIATPLASLTKKMERVGKGDFSSDLKIHANDELGQLAGAVNQMCDRLRQQQQTIEKETHQRIDAIEQLRHADRLKTVGQLAAGFAHEVGTPLNVISGRAEMILSDPNRSPEQIAKHATAVKTESERISKIIQKLLHFSRRSPSQKSTNDLREVIQHSVDLIQPLADKQRIKLIATVPAVAAEASFDFNQLQQVIMNLIDNAVDASSADQTVTICLHPQPIDGQWKIEVIDHGSGIEQNQLDVIFEPFFTTKEVGSGTGLGLSIVHGIIEEHGGSIDCQSNPEKGTTMTVRMPTDQTVLDKAVTNTASNDQTNN
jgi:two-component system, NtrC family, sensor kinase